MGTLCERGFVHGGSMRCDSMRACERASDRAKKGQRKERVPHGVRGARGGGAASALGRSSALPSPCTYPGPARLDVITSLVPRCAVVSPGQRLATWQAATCMIRAKKSVAGKAGSGATLDAVTLTNDSRTSFTDCARSSNSMSAAVHTSHQAVNLLA
eukprot:3486539-Rhodomonas_salina.2